MVNSNLPMVSVIIPMKDEEQYIGRCLEAVINQDYPEGLTEIIVVDGGSSDGSLKVVRELMKEHCNIRLLGGPGVNCPAAMNIGIQNATGDIIAKIDAHGYPAADFLRMSARRIAKATDIKCVGGPIRQVAETSIAKANVLARSSVFGVGRGIYSMGDKAQFVDTVQCGVYERGVFEEVGLFDESLQFGEDEEINWRIRKRGYRIFATPEIRFFYFPRNSFRKLYWQYFNYGMLRAAVIWKHPDFCRIKHLMPTIFVLALFLTAMFAIFSNVFSKVFLGIFLIYLGASLAVSTVISVKEGREYLCLLPISFGALHFGYGLGFARGIMRLRSHKRVSRLRSKGNARNTSGHSRGSCF